MASPFGNKVKAAGRRGSMPRVGAEVEQMRMPRSLFDRSHGVTTTFDAGLLVPVFVDEALPGDTLSLNMEVFARLNTPVFPVMHGLYCDVFFFACPHRLLQDNWEKLHGAQDDPGDSVDFLTPQIVGNAPAELSLSDYFGLPVGQGSFDYNAFHHRCYNKVINEWFRDQDLVDSLPEHKDDGPDPIGDYNLFRRAKRADYFSGCRPFAQKGDPVSLPLGTSAPVTISGDGDPTFDIGGQTALTLGHDSGKSNPSPKSVDWSTDPSDDASATWNDPALSGSVDLSNASSASVNEFRDAVTVQQMFERDARSGTRYVELLQSHYGVTNPDLRMQRSVFLGGGSFRMNVHPIQATAVGFSGNLGDPGAFAIASGRAGFNQSFTEHCVLIGLANVRADLVYQNGINRMWTRRERFDYAYPTFAHLGEQVVESREIYADGTGDPDATPPTGDYSVFGYQERYAEYRWKPSLVTGRMRSNAATPLDQWHLALDFDTRPLLNETFIQDHPPISRVVAVDTEPDVLFDSWSTYRCARPIPAYSTPGLRRL